jgi:hypothetical protein
MAQIEVKLTFENPDECKRIIEGIRQMQPPDSIVEDASAELSAQLMIEVPTGDQPVHQVAMSAADQALERAGEIVRGGKQIAGLPHAYVEAATGMWPGMG